VEEVRTMTVRLEDLELFPDETEIKTESVFLEKAVQPSSKNGEGIPRGILRLTNRRIFFLNTGIGKDKGLLNEDHTRLLSLALNVVGAVVPQAEKISGYSDKIIEFAEGSSQIAHRFGKEKLKNVEQTLDSEYSFVVPIDHIVGYRLFPIRTGSYMRRMGHGFKLWFQDKWFISQYVELSIRNDFGLTETFCIYCNRPRDPEEYRNVISYYKWYNEIKKLLPNI
jgi:hypothetical protein